MLQQIARTPALLVFSAALVISCPSCTGSGGEGRDDSPTPSLSSAPSATSPATTPSAEAAASAEPTAESEGIAAADAVRAYYRTVDELYSDPASSMDRVAEVAGGTELDELRTLLQQQRAEGARQTGSVGVVSVVTTEELPGPPSTVRADVCIDVSGVDVLDAGGTSVVSSERLARSLVHVVVIDRGVNGWLVEQTVARGEPCSAA